VKVKNVIFDLGAVMFNWNPKAITENFTDDVELQKRIQSELYYHQDWIDFDCALIAEVEATKRASERLEISLIDVQKLFRQTKECLFIDDSNANISTATKPGITVITFKGLDSCYKKICSHI